MPGPGSQLIDLPMFEDMWGNKYQDYYWGPNGFIVITDKGKAIEVGETENPLGDAGEWQEGGWGDLIG